MSDGPFDLEGQPPAPTDPWSIFSYEVTMYWGMIRVREQISKAKKWEIVVGDQSESQGIHKAQNVLVMNAMIESKLLHTRVLADILLGRTKSKDDLTLTSLIKNWNTDGRLTLALNKLAQAYGNSKTEQSPCWIINKMVAHPSNLRANSYNYSALFEIIDPPLKECLKRVVEIKSDHYLLNILGQI